MGVIDIGGGGFTYDMLDRAYLRYFAISIHATVFNNYVYDQENQDFIYIDNMFLIPADHFLFVELDTVVGGPANADKRVEIYMNEDNSVQGLVVRKNTSNFLGQPLAGEQAIYEAVATIDHSNWGMPILENSKLVFVADGDNKTISKTAIVNLQFESQPRTPFL